MSFSPHIEPLEEEMNSFLTSAEHVALQMLAPDAVSLNQQGQLSELMGTGVQLEGHMCRPSS